jgi:hypothetical protein
MLKNETFQKLLTGGLDDYWKSVCRAWIDESKQLYGVETDQQTIARFSDTELFPRLLEGSILFSNTSLLKCNFIGLPTPRFAVQAIQKEGDFIVVIHEGFLHLTTFLTETHLLSRILWERLTYLDKKDATKLDIYLKMAKIKITKKFLKEPFRLPSFYKKFTDDIKRLIDDEIISIISFAIYHELAHIELGHCSPPINAIGAAGPHLLIDESVNVFKKQEFEADEHAMRAVQDNYDSYSSGACLFLYNLALIEIYTTDTRPTHPLSANRIKHLESTFSSSFSEELKTLYDKVARELAEDFKQHRDDDLHIMFELFALADIDPAIKELTTIANTIFEGDRIVNKYLESSQGKKRIRPRWIARLLKRR